jgi:predicted dehydrogenase
MNRKLIISHLVIIVMIAACQSPQKEVTDSDAVKLVTVDPGHFHAALVQKTMYPGVDSVVHVYAPEGNDLQLHLGRIDAYNKREAEPTRWKEEVYASNDFFEKMIAEKAGNVVMLAGNNRKKTEYIYQSLQAGFNVLADKPMAIDSNNFELLKKAFSEAEQRKLLLYDIMTERWEITSILQRRLSQLEPVFGVLQKGTAEKPAVVQDGVHYFYKYISGNVLTRPAWFMDVTQQGEGIVDVTTHLVDLVQWICFPEQALDYTKDIQVQAARRWPTNMSLQQFSAITKLDSFPGYLAREKLSDTMLQVYCNGEINYEIRGVHTKISVVWDYKAQEGAGDTYYSYLQGSKANLVIRQGAEQQFKPVLYIEPVSSDTAYEKTLLEQIKSIQADYPGVELKKETKGWQVFIPEKYKEGHEAHFAQVTKKYLEYLSEKNMPAWEVPNMIAKYYVTTKALQLAKQKK